MKEELKNGFLVLGICAILLVVGFTTGYLNTTGNAISGYATAKPIPLCDELNQLITDHINTKCGDANYDHRADINKDKYVAVNDFNYVALMYSASWCKRQLNSKENPCTVTTKNEQNCVAQEGSWYKFFNICADKCTQKNCRLGEAYGCDCGPDKCWDTANKKCIINSCAQLYDSIKLSMNSKCGMIKYNFRADVNKDMQVNGNDAAYVNLHYSDEWCKGQLLSEDNPCNKAPEDPKCTAAGGTWVEFADSCADQCEKIYFNDNSAPIISCLQTKTYGCDCGVDKCWDGANKKCIINNCASLYYLIKTHLNTKCGSEKYDFRADVNKDRQVNGNDAAYVNLHYSAEWCTNQIESRENPCTAICGNGIIEAGEQCDPAANQNTCPTESTCSKECKCITFPQVRLSHITLVPASANIYVGNSVSYTVTAHYTDGTAKVVTASTKCTSSNIAIASVSRCVAKGVAKGAAEIKAVYAERAMNKTAISSLEVAPLSTNCTDSDGGKNYGAYGFTIVSYENGRIVKKTIDSCLQGTLLKEAYCEGSQALTTDYDCANEGKICKGGACIKQECVGEGKSLGAVIPSNTAVCCSGLTQIDTSVSGGGDICEERTGSRGYCTYCGNGVCRNPENQCNCPKDCKPVCTDTDGGKNYTVKGTTTDSTGNVRVDTCASNGIQITEYSCSPQGNVRGTGFTCLNGCEDGACRCIKWSPPPPGWCDGGRIIPQPNDADGCARPAKCQM